MPGPFVLAFVPVPLRSRSDGWSADRQRDFILALARGLTPAAAARLVGRNRQNAYALRKRTGAESFAAAWDAAIAYARRERAPAPVDRSRPSNKADSKALARLGLESVERAATVSDAARRRAFSEMLDSFYGPKNDTRAIGEKQASLGAKSARS